VVVLGGCVWLWLFMGGGGVWVGLGGGGGGGVGGCGKTVVHGRPLSQHPTTKGLLVWLGQRGHASKRHITRGGKKHTHVRKTR